MTQLWVGVSGGGGVETHRPPLSWLPCGTLLEVSLRLVWMQTPSPCIYEWQGSLGKTLGPITRSRWVHVGHSAPSHA